MYDLFIRTISQGLQAFLPIVVWLTWFRRAGDADAGSGVRRGMIAALPATVAAAYLFRLTSRQALWEAGLALAALTLALWFAHRVGRGLPVPGTDGAARQRYGYGLAWLAGAALIITRQTMEIVVTFAAAVQWRSIDALLAIAGGAAVALVLIALWRHVGRGLPDPVLAQVTALFSVLFVGQIAIYAFHESAEARLLPWSDVLHAATEPYGPDGIYGRYVSGLVCLITLACAKGLAMKTRTAAAGRTSRVLRRAPLAAAAVVLVLIAVGVALAAALNAERTGSDATPRAAEAAAPARDLATL